MKESLKPGIQHQMRFIVSESETVAKLYTGVP